MGCQVKKVPEVPVFVSTNRKIPDDNGTPVTVNNRFALFISGDSEGLATIKGIWSLANPTKPRSKPRFVTYRVVAGKGGSRTAKVERIAQIKVMSIYIWGSQARFAAHVLGVRTIVCGCRGQPSKTETTAGSLSADDAQPKQSSQSNVLNGYQLHSDRQRLEMFTTAVENNFEVQEGCRKGRQRSPLPAEVQREVRP